MQATITLDDSSCLSGFHYDFTSQVLEVVFHSQRYYAYRVEPDLFADFLLAESKGQFYNRYIKHLHRI